MTTYHTARHNGQRDEPPSFRLLSDANLDLCYQRLMRVFHTFHASRFSSSDATLGYKSEMIIRRSFLTSHFSPPLSEALSSKSTGDLWFCYYLATNQKIFFALPVDCGSTPGPYPGRSRIDVSNLRSPSSLLRKAWAVYSRIVPSNTLYLGPLTGSFPPSPLTANRVQASAYALKDGVSTIESSTIEPSCR